MEVLTTVVPLKTRTVWLVIGDPPSAGIVHVALTDLLRDVAIGANGVAGTVLTTGIVVVVGASGSLLTKARRFGEPVPTDVMIPVVAFVVISEATSAGVKSPFNCKVSAANPAT